MHAFLWQRLNQNNFVIYPAVSLSFFSFCCEVSCSPLFSFHFFFFFFALYPIVPAGGEERKGKGCCAFFHFHFSLLRLLACLLSLLHWRSVGGVVKKNKIKEKKREQ